MNMTCRDLSWRVRKTRRASCWRQCRTMGAAILADDGAYTARRVELGRPIPGRELTGDYNPLEAGMQWVCAENKGCYTGQEIIARQVTYDKVTKTLVGLRCHAAVAIGETVAVDGDKRRPGHQLRVQPSPRSTSGPGYRAQTQQCAGRPRCRRQCRGSRRSASLCIDTEIRCTAGMSEMVFEHAEWRLIIEAAPRSGAANMAIDQAIADACAAGASPPTLRFYRWDPPAVSLGRHQPIADIDVPAATALGYDVVRRPTGGRAILHTDELTYSVAAPAHEARVQGSVMDAYLRLSNALLMGLLDLGLTADKAAGNVRAGPDVSAACFEVPQRV